MQSSVGVVGAAGFIGQKLTELLVSRGLNVSKFSTASPLISDGKFDESFYSLQALVWLASRVNPQTAESTPSLLESDLTDWKKFLVMASKCPSPPRIIFVSSGGCVYSDENSPFKEESRATGINAYGRLKISQEELLIKSGLQNTILRVANVYGPHQPIGRGQGVIAEWLFASKNKMPLEIIGGLENFRDFIHIDDVCSAILNTIESGYTGLLNIGTGKKTSLKDLLNVIRLESEASIETNHLPSRDVDRSGYFLDISKAELEIKWKPQISLQDGIRSVLNSSA